MFIRVTLVATNNLIFNFDDGDYFIPSFDNEKEIVEKMKKVSSGERKINQLFHSIFNGKFVVQDIIDYHMDREIDWEFINLCLKVAKQLKRLS